jgi:hypothetical protein
VFGPAARRNLGDAGNHLWKIVYRVFKPDLILVIASALGLLAFAAGRLREKIKQGGALRAADLFTDGIAIPPAVYVCFCLINIQGGPDLIPLVPFIGLFAGWLLVRLGRVASGRRLAVIMGSPGVDRILIGAAVIVILLIGVYRAAAYRIEGWTLRDQDKALGRGRFCSRAEGRELQRVD